jgi:prepilin-type N-terminal cleavage/methylation domain-containing protein
MIPRNKRSEKGFTLIEVIMATMILVIGIGMIGTITSGIVRKNFHSQNHTQAVILAQNKIEELLAKGYTNSDLGAGEYENLNNPVNSTADSSGIFYQSWKIEDVKPIARSKYITSTVQWTDSAHKEHTVNLTAVCIDQSN